jgi:AP2 domain
MAEETSKEQSPIGKCAKSANSAKSSRFRGVTRFRGRWVSQINFQNTYCYLGGFAEEVQAAQAYDRCSEPHRI